MCKRPMLTAVAHDVQKPDANSPGPGKGLGLVRGARTSVELSGPKLELGICWPHVELDERNFFFCHKGSQPVSTEVSF